MPTNHIVKTAVYEGPLELLLELIEKRKLLINDISLADVTDEYIARINGMESLPVGETADFVALAATLLLIKSRSLLPSLEISDEESRDIKELEYRLALYQLLRSTTPALRSALGAPMLYEIAAPEDEPLFIPDDSITIQSLLSAARMLVDGFPKSLSMPQVDVKKVVSLEEMIERLHGRIAAAMRMSFKEFAGSSKARPDIIVSFLALLELVKRGIITATQEESGDITLEHDAVSTPTYE